MDHRRRGFTLVELMVVLGVVSVLAVMIVPRFEGTYRKSLLRATARGLAAAVDLASSRAATTARLHRLRVDPVSGEWAIEERVTGGRFERVSSVPGAAGRLEPGIRIRLERFDAAPLLAEAGPRQPEPSRAAPGFAPSGGPAPARAAGGARERPPVATSPGGPATGDSRAPADTGYEPAVTFKPDGTSDGGELVFEVEDGSQMALRIHPSTGRVRIIDLGRDLGPGAQPPRSTEP